MNSFFQLFHINRAHFIAIIIVSFLFFLGNGQFDLFDNSETHYTRVSQEMVATGDYINLSFNGEPWFVHPPLYFWTTSIITKFFGWEPGVLRFQEAFFSTGIVLLTYLLANLFFGSAIAIGASLICATSLYIIILGKLAIFDAHLYFFMMMSLYIILSYLYLDKRRGWWMIAAGVATGLGILSKGPIALVQQLLILFPFILVTKQYHFLRSFWVWLGIIVSLLVPSPWYAHQLLHHGMPFLMRHYVTILGIDFLEWLKIKKALGITTLLFYLVFSLGLHGYHILFGDFLNQRY